MSRAFDLLHVLALETVAKAGRPMTPGEVALVTPLSVDEAEEALVRCHVLGVVERVGASFRVRESDPERDSFALRDALRLAAADLEVDAGDRR